MNKFVKSMLNLGELEQFARRDLWVNGLNPTLKILVTLGYIIWVTSLDKYALSQVLVFGVYPIMIYSLSSVPFKALLSKLTIPALFSISLGALNPLFDQEIIWWLSGVGISGGVVSLVTLFIKAIYTISATLLLVSTTTIESIGKGLETLRVPSRIIMLLLLMYRYIGVLLNEVNRTMEAYQLRARGKNIHVSAWGSLVGQIMIRSYRRSEEIYNAMLLRGYSANERSTYES